MIAKYYKETKELMIAETTESEIKERLIIKTEDEAKKICKERKIKLLK